MTIDSKHLDGTSLDSEEILRALQEQLFPDAIKAMNEETLPFQFALFGADVVPTNQRNLTDVRTRMGVLLEYELAKAINGLLPAEARQAVTLTYVIANKFPDLAFRTPVGGIGVRFEVKAIEIIAEEKSANFDTLIKDIRQGTDFVVVLVWEWCSSGTRSLRFPCIYGAFVMDAYQLAQMRDCYWLNCPPSNVGAGRQGYDLCFGVNCNAGKFNKEEGTYGKLMRIFDRDFERFLPEGIVGGRTLATYYAFRESTIRLGLQHVGLDIAVEAAAGRRDCVKLVSEGLPVVILSGVPGKNLLVVGSNAAPARAEVVPLMKAHDAGRVLTMNAKFDWWVKDREWQERASGRKPVEAKAWATEWAR